MAASNASLLPYIMYHVIPRSGNSPAIVVPSEYVVTMMLHTSIQMHSSRTLLAVHQSRSCMKLGGD